MTAQKDFPTLLRWYGGKHRNADWIISNIPEHRVYVEPFGGAAAVLLRKPVSTIEAYNDLNSELFNLFRMLRDRRDDLERAVRLTPWSEDEWVLSNQPSDDPLEQARRTFVRYNQSFAGIGDSFGFSVDTSSRGMASTVAGWEAKVSFLKKFCDRIGRVQIFNRDAERVITSFDSPNTVFYCDPPYLGTARKDRASKPYKHEMMSDEQHGRLSAMLHSVKGMVLLSGYKSPLYDKLYGDWYFTTKGIACYCDNPRVGDSTDRGTRTEVLWLNPAAMKRHPEPMLWNS